MRNSRDWEVRKSDKNYLKNSFLMYDFYRYYSSLQGINLKHEFILALQHDQIEFVKLLLDHDFALNDLFQTGDDICSLYKICINKQDVRLYEIYLKYTLSIMLLQNTAQEQQKNITNNIPGYNSTINRRYFQC